jgi:predicted nucleic acid-binding protein
MPAWQEVLTTAGAPIQPADAQVFVLARDSGFQSLVLTDDLVLRRLLESQGTRVTGTVGVLIRAYSSGRISRADLDSSIAALFDASSLHLSRGFRIYVKNLLETLP